MNIPPLQKTEPGIRAVNFLRFRASTGTAEPKMPLDVSLHRFHVINRLFIETVGYYLWAILFARNNYEKLEKAADLACWVVIGLVLPYYFAKGLFKGLYTRNLVRNFRLAMKQPLSLPLERLNEDVLFNPVKRARLIKELGLKNPRRLREVVDKIRLGKMGILLSDLLFMASKGQLYFWGKNWLTEHLSGKKGFVGEFGYTSDAYRELKAAEAEKKKKKNLVISLICGYGAAVGLPLLIWFLLKGRTPIASSIVNAKGAFAKLKSMVRGFNYTDVIFLSKWVILWHGLFNWQLPGLMSARDSHERREHLARSTCFDFFYILGDDIFAGIAANAFTKKYGKYLKMPIVSKGLFNFPVITAPHEVFNKVGLGTTLNYARLSSGIGLLGTAICMGIGTTLINNWYTRKKALKEQAELEMQEKMAKPKQPKPTAIKRVPSWKNQPNLPPRLFVQPYIPFQYPYQPYQYSYPFLYPYPQYFRNFIPAQPAFT